LIRFVHLERLRGYASETHGSASVCPLEHLERGSVENLAVIGGRVERHATRDDAEVREFELELHHATTDAGLAQASADA
jgi:hypothetical protein